MVWKYRWLRQSKSSRLDLRDKRDVKAKMLHLCLLTRVIMILLAAGKGVGRKNRYAIGVMSGGPGRASRYRCSVSNYKYFSVLSDLEILDT